MVSLKHQTLHYKENYCNSYECNSENNAYKMHKVRRVGAMYSDQTLKCFVPDHAHEALQMEGKENIEIKPN